jgi:hypothetical protein
LNNGVQQLLDTVSYHVHTMWLFTKSDFMTTMIPIVSWLHTFYNFN